MFIYYIIVCYIKYFIISPDKFQSDLPKIFRYYDTCTEGSSSKAIEKHNSLNSTQLCGALCMGTDGCHFIFMIGLDCYLASFFPKVTITVADVLDSCYVKGNINILPATILGTFYTQYCHIFNLIQPYSGFIANWTLIWLNCSFLS